jgi:P-type Cu2+ transporter
MLAPPGTAPPLDAIPGLDDHREWLAFSRPVAGQAGCWESNFVVSGMHCAACSVTVEDAVRALAGVVTATVSYASGRASVRWLQGLTAPADLLRAVQQSGYQAVPANDTFLRETRLQQSRKALWRWLVAGFCVKWSNCCVGPPGF